MTPGGPPSAAGTARVSDAEIRYATQDERDRWAEALEEVADAMRSSAKRVRAVRPGSMDERLTTARGLVDYALHLRMYGERAPGGDETWRAWDLAAEAYMRANTPAGGAP